jgi:hypothetical protein
LNLLFGASIHRLDSIELSSPFPFASLSHAESLPNFLDFLARASRTDVGEHFAKCGHTAAHSEPQVIQTISPILKYAPAVMKSLPESLK